MNLANFILFFAQSQPEKNSTPDWGMWGVIATFIVGVIIPIILCIVQAKRKSIKITQVSSAPLVTINDRFVDNLEVTYKGKKIENATTIVLRITNSGNQAITKNDFEESIIIMFNHNAKIIKAEVLYTRPTNIKPNILIEEDVIELKPLLINPKDIIEISAIVSSFEEYIEIGGRIKDIKDIKIENENSKSNMFQIAFILYLCSVILMLTIMITNRSNLSPEKINHIYLTSVGLVSTILSFTALYSYKVLAKLTK